MSLSSKFLQTFQKNDKYYNSPLKTVSEERFIDKKLSKDKINNYLKTYSNIRKRNFPNRIDNNNKESITANLFNTKTINLPLLIDKNNISTFYRMKQYKVSLPKHREKKETNDMKEEKKINKFVEQFTIYSYKKKSSNTIRGDDKKYDFNSYLKMQSRAEVAFRPRYGDNSLDLINYIQKVSGIRRSIMKDFLDEIRGAENRFNAEKPDVDSNFTSKNKVLIDNRWKNSFSLEEYQQFFMKNLKGKISSMNYRQMLKKFRQISLMCFSEGNNNYSSIKRLDYHE